MASSVIVAENGKAIFWYMQKNDDLAHATLVSSLVDNDNVIM